MTLSEIRKRRNITQEELAIKLRVRQSRVSKMERQIDDPRLSTLIRYAYALGGELEVKFKFSGGGRFKRFALHPVVPAK